MCGYYVWQMPLGVSKLKASRREVRHYTPRSDPRDWLDILRRKRFRVFHEKNVRRKLFSRVDTISTSANTKRTNTTYIIMINSTGWWMLVITEGDPRIFFFDDIIFVFLLFLYSRSHSSSSRSCSCSLSVHRNVSNRPGTTRGICDSNLYTENTIYYIYFYVLLLSLFISASFDLGPKVEATFHLSSTIKVWQIGLYCAAAAQISNVLNLSIIGKEKNRGLFSGHYTESFRPQEKYINFGNYTISFSR